MQRAGRVAYHQEQTQRQRTASQICRGLSKSLYKDFKEGLYHPLTFSEPHSVDSNPRFHCPGQTLNS